MGYLATRVVDQRLTRTVPRSCAIHGPSGWSRAHSDAARRRRTARPIRAGGSGLTVRKEGHRGNLAARFGATPSLIFSIFAAVLGPLAPPCASFCDPFRSPEENL